MKYSVNENCIGCGQCHSTCPEVFHMSDSGVSVAISQPVPAEAEEAAAVAMAECPVAAIEKV